MLVSAVDIRVVHDIIVDPDILSKEKKATKTCLLKQKLRLKMKKKHFCGMKTLVGSNGATCVTKGDKKNKPDIWNENEWFQSHWTLA